MNYEKKTKIVCTIGPASWDPDIMRAMIDAGMNCARVNGAFADEAELDKVTKLVRDISSEVSLMMDVKGPEVRMNKFTEVKSIKPGDMVVIGNDDSSEIYPGNYKDLYKVLSPGQRIVVGDGDVEMILKEIKEDKMYCEVKFGETLKPGKALNLPGANFATSALTEKDIANLKHSIALGWDFVSASFIQDRQSAQEIKKYLEGSHMKLIAKIEDQTGVDNIDEILEEVEGVMVARGGLGVELGLEKVPQVQKMLIEKCNSVGKPVITCTQMLESMTTNPRPTRAEVNDVATAIMQGTDAIMLSAESSAGKYPVESVQEVTRIAIETENHIPPKIEEGRADAFIVTDALSKAAAKICIEMGEEIDKVIVVSRTGNAARLVGRHNIKQHIFAFTSEDYYMRRMMLSKGLNRSIVLKQTYSDRDAAVKAMLILCREQGIANSGDKILLICKTPLEHSHYFPNIFEILQV